MNLSYSEMKSPVGKLKLVADEKALVAILWEDDRRHQKTCASASRNDDHAILRAACRELAEYFAGSRSVFNVPLRPAGTSFQLCVWQQLREIPFGESRSYGALARAIGRPSAARAVGAANRCNPLSIVVPCHRVIGSTGRLTGFAGGLDVKAYLLAHERSVLGQNRAR